MDQKVPLDDAMVAKSEMPPWFVVFFEQYVRQRDEMLGMIQRNVPTLPGYSQKRDSVAPPQQSYFDDDPESGAVDPMALKKQSLQITLIEGGILFHSVFVGMTVSIAVDGFVVLLIAIVFHQMFDGLGLGSRIAAVPYPKGSWRPWVLVTAFGTTAPLGQALGLATRGVVRSEQRVRSDPSRLVQCHVSAPRRPLLSLTAQLFGPVCCMPP